jgi:hypothetical protein
MTTWTPADIQAQWYAPLYRGASTYELQVFGPYSDGRYDVEVHVDGTFCGTKTLERNTHIIGDMYDFVTRCIEAEQLICFDNHATLCE